MTIWFSPDSPSQFRTVASAHIYLEARAIVPLKLYMSAQHSKPLILFSTSAEVLALLLSLIRNYSLCNKSEKSHVARFHGSSNTDWVSGHRCARYKHWTLSLHRTLSPSPYLTTLLLASVYQRTRPSVLKFHVKVTLNLSVMSVAQTQAFYTLIYF